MPAKTKKPQPQTPENLQGRDFFQTPNYATDLIVPFLRALAWSNGRRGNLVIWECASGDGKISKRLEHHGFEVISTDLQSGFNFLTGTPDFHFDIIVTNPAFSIKQKFYDKCVEYGLPFALLIPADYTGWLIDAS